MYVPVQSSLGTPLMPCHPARARELIRKGRAVKRYADGIMYIRMLDRESGDLQPIACGIDPGSKKEGLTVKSEKTTFLNIQADAVTWVKDAVEVRRNMRRARRFRKTPYRASRRNRSRGGLPPSTKARWQWKLRLSRWLSSLYPISVFVVEDIKAKTLKGKRRWNKSFSPLEVGKKWFYSELSAIAEVQLKPGWETARLREYYGLNKTSAKMTEVFEAHCVDSWVLAADAIGGEVPDNTHLLLVTPLRFHRRQLHALQPAEGGVRRAYGSTRSLSFKRGSTVKHPKHGVCYVGGTSGTTISLHRFSDGKRLCQNAKPGDSMFLCYSSFRARFLPAVNGRVSARLSG